LDADQRGDISSALSKLERVLELDRRAPELTTSGRATAYQNLYNKVRSEHEAINAACAEARRQLENGDFAGALSICAAQLAKYPGQVLFQALKIDTEERYRQALSARIAEIDRKVEAERDLDQRVSLVEKTLQENPGETYFEQLLQRTREKRDFVAATVKRARTYEEQGQFNEALAQWEILRTIYNRHPGLNVEIERLTRRCEQQLNDSSALQLLSEADRREQQHVKTRKETAELYNQPAEVQRVRELGAAFTHELEPKLLSPIAEAERQRLVQTSLKSAGRLLADGDVESARALVNRTRAIYPNDRVLADLETLTSKSISSSAGATPYAYAVASIRSISPLYRDVTYILEAGVLTDLTQFPVSDADCVLGSSGLANSTFDSIITQEGQAESIEFDITLHAPEIRVHPSWHQTFRFSKAHDLCFSFQ